MTKEQLRVDTVKLCNQVSQDENRIQKWNMIPYSFVKWVKIVKVYKHKKDKIMLPDKYDNPTISAPFYYFTFDFEHLKTSAFQVDQSLN